MTARLSFRPQPLDMPHWVVQRVFRDRALWHGLLRPFWLAHCLLHLLVACLAPLHGYRSSAPRARGSGFARVPCHSQDLEQRRSQEGHSSLESLRALEQENAVLHAELERYKGASQPQHAAGSPEPKAEPAEERPAAGCLELIVSVASSTTSSSALLSASTAAFPTSPTKVLDSCRIAATM